MYQSKIIPLDLCVYVCTCIYHGVLGCMESVMLMLLSNQIFELEQHKLNEMGGGDNRCGSGLLGVTSNRYGTFPRWNSFSLLPHALATRLEQHQLMLLCLGNATHSAV